MSGSGTGTPAASPVLTSSGTYNRFKIREEVRRIIRDPDYPKQDIDKAINSIISSINLLGRFKFHQGYYDLTMVQNQKEYAIPNFIAEELVVLEPGEEEQGILVKPPDLIDPFSSGRFIETGDSPAYYLFWGGNIWIDPIPSAAAAGKTVRVYGYYFLPLLSDDITIVGLNDFYCVSVLAWGAASEINPSLIVESSGKQSSIRDIFEMNLKGMIRSEMWNPMVSPNIIRDYRWNGMSRIGYVGRIRG